MATPTREQLLAAVGDALAQWCQVELVLASLFARLSDIATWQKAHTIFDTIIGFETRADIVDALMRQESLSDLEQEIWNKLSTKMRKQYKKRHALAHFAIGSKSGTPVLSPFFNYKTLIDGNIKTLSIEDIAQRAQEFQAVFQGVTWAWYHAGLRRGLPPDIPEREPEIVGRLRELAAQSLQERERKQQPVRQ